jgi:hypothetical protein
MKDIRNILMIYLPIFCIMVISLTLQSGNYPLMICTVLILITIGIIIRSEKNG